MPCCPRVPCASGGTFFRFSFLHPVNATSVLRLIRSVEIVRRITQRGNRRTTANNPRTKSRWSVSGPVTSEKNSDVKRPSSSATAERTGPIIFFDGVCGLCNRSVDFVLARDGDEQFRFAPLQGETAQAALSASDIQTLGSLVFVSESGTSRHSTAIVRILWKLGGIWSFWGNRSFEDGSSSALATRIDATTRNATTRSFISGLRFRGISTKLTCPVLPGSGNSFDQKTRPAAPGQV